MTPEEEARAIAAGCVHLMQPGNRIDWNVGDMACVQCIAAALAERERIVAAAMKRRRAYLMRFKPGQTADDFRAWRTMEMIAEEELDAAVDALAATPAAPPEAGR